MSYCAFFMSNNLYLVKLNNIIGQNDMKVWEIFIIFAFVMTEKVE